jgi:dihydrofolate reductase
LTLRITRLTNLKHEVRHEALGILWSERRRLSGPTRPLARFLETGEQEPHGFEEFYSTLDVVVIGRKTFEVVLTFGKWFYGKKQVVVLSSSPLDFSTLKDAVIEQMSGELPKLQSGSELAGSNMLM